MPTNRENLIKDCATILSVYSNYISHLSSINMNDAAIIAESNMLDIVNFIFDKNFKDTNKEFKLNFPGIDYLDEKSKSGMQVTKVASVSKIKKSIDKLIENTNIQIDTVWFLFLINKKYSPMISFYRDKKIITATLASIFIKIETLNDNKLKQARTLLEPLYLHINKAETKMIEQVTPITVPSSFCSFATVVDNWITNQFNLSPPHFQYVFDKKLFTDSMIKFIGKLYQIPKSIRSFIASIMILALPTKTAREGLKVSDISLYHNLKEDSREYLDDYVEYLKEINLLQIYNEFLEIDYTKNNEIDIHLKTKRTIEISYLIDDLELDIFTVLRFFYLKKYSTKELYEAFENANFKLLK
ncbi:SMEK domain-containing protein [Proteus mirabilis]|uniref:SMEK domain-containing protein n=1 Tax=Proteus mirabilis TaxID=584 RepID=UPI0013EE5A51|nr:SMEK domain-containing protein [Proteus mirabilis]NGX90801.1 SMEK domain-containing protein [Proteus mirabilis]